MDNHKITINAPRFKEEDDASTKLDYLYVTTVAHAHLIQSLTFNYHRGGVLSMLESKFPKDVQRLKTVINRIEDLQRLPDGGEQLYSYMQLHKEDLKQFSMLDSILKKIGTQSSVNLIEEDDVLGNMDKYTNRWPKMIKSPSDWDFFGSGSAVKLGILNGFGTGFGDIFNGNNALKIAIKMLEKRGINLETNRWQK